MSDDRNKSAWQAQGCLLILFMLFFFPIGLIMMFHVAFAILVIVVIGGFLYKLLK